MELVLILGLTNILAIVIPGTYSVGLQHPQLGVFSQSLPIWSQPEAVFASMRYELTGCPPLFLRNKTLSNNPIHTSGTKDKGKKIQDDSAAKESNRESTSRPPEAPRSHSW